MGRDVLRTPKTLKRYFAQLDNKAKDPGALLYLVRRWTGNFWYIAKNDFPYDKIASQHDLLIPIRVFGDDWQMTHEEREELTLIRQSLLGDYDVIMENTPRRRTVRAHYHLHLIKYKNITDYHG